ncbi:LysR family transcriptional regulator [Poseidonocella sedimentorum]|uniref:LysR family transcriptional regulator, glycine cleavage system transcriptional activator n=1 Tax=Poseidonocella sedimentorum TaxID=871652 RepID=A0A1I6DUK7_9RHOB|nr:LysR family transcriptional regulator [Poseidonocella sedimentorum]SFR08988.1 LysR family transcriptional regulator, glycine cleavage system transcriptional activator [Poseidonocella sedimentorum]
MDWHAMPPLATLRALEAFARCGTMTAAGEALNITHAAVSQQLRALEERLGIALLERHGKSVSLTPDGLRLARSVCSGFEEMAREIDALTTQQATRSISVTASPGFSAAWLMPRLGTFAEEHPEIGVSINPTREVVQLAPGGADVAIRHGRGDWPGLEAELFLRGPMAVVGAPELIGSRSVDRPEDLAEFRWFQEIGMAEANEWLTRHGVCDQRPGGLFQAPGNLVMDGVRNGQGVAVLCRSFIEPDLASGRLKVLFEEDDGRAYWLVTLPGVQRPALRAFCNWLRKERDRQLADQQG